MDLLVSLAQRIHDGHQVHGEATLMGQVLEAILGEMSVSGETRDGVSTFAVSPKEPRPGKRWVAARQVTDEIGPSGLKGFHGRDLLSVAAGT